jgi:iron(III) transport system permease protein
MFLVGFIFTLRESSITQLVYPAGYETLPVYILTQMANGKTEIIASLCVILTLMMIVPLFTLLSVGNTHDRV